MSTIKLQGIEYDLPNVQMDETNLIRICITYKGRTEKVWAYVSDQDLRDYKADVKDLRMFRVAIIGNDAACGIPCGCYIPFQMVGQNVPVLELTDPKGFPMQEEYGESEVKMIEEKWGTVPAEQLEKYCKMHLNYGWLEQKSEWKARIEHVLAHVYH